MRIRRDVNSIPQRSAMETWNVIRELITGDKSVDAGQIEKAGPIIASIITDELIRTSPIIIENVGPQIRIYGRYEFDATQGTENIDELPANPTAGDWVMRVPCDEENFSWVKKSLAAVAPRIIVYNPDSDVDAVKGEQSSANFEVNWNIKE